MAGQLGPIHLLRPVGRDFLEKRETFVWQRCALWTRDYSRVDTGVTWEKPNLKSGSPKTKSMFHIPGLVSQEIQGTILLRVLEIHSGIVQKLQVVVRTTSNNTA